MTKLVAVLGMLVLAPAVYGQTQERPNYSGTWVLVANGSKPPSQGAFGNRFKLSQSATTVTIETALTVHRGTRGPDGVMINTQSEVLVAVDYICDGVEHDEVLPSSFPGAGPAPPGPGAMVSTPSPATYRGTWMVGQLIIIRQTKTPPGLSNVVRLALSLDADGSLVVDSLVVPLLPRANGPKQEPPMSVRSVYKKAS